MTGVSAMLNATVMSRKVGLEKYLMVAAAMIGLVGLNTAALADQAGGQARAKTVSLTDIDLSTAEGQRVAHERLHQAARYLCARVADDLDMSHRENYLACIDAALATAGTRLQAMASRSSTGLLALK
jgi:UrcA family protein